MATLERPHRPARGRRLALAASLAVVVAAACTLVNPLDRYQAEKDRPDAPASTSTDAGTDAGADGGPSWKRYELDFASATWSLPVNLTELWSDPNAPPPRGIVTAVQLTDDDRLIVFADDGKVYTQAGAAWLPPAPIADAWNPLTKAPEAAYHVPFAFTRTIAPDASDVEGITFIDSPNAYLFTYTKDGTAHFDQSRPLTQDDGGPPTSAHAMWSFELLDLGNVDPAQHYKNFTLWDDGILYEFWADFSFHDYPIAESPLWKGKTNAAPPRGIAAAYFDQAKGAQGTAYFIGP